MNRGQLNGYAINGQIADPVVRVRVDARGYAMGRAHGRVLAYGKVAALGRGIQSGIAGRVEAHLSVEAEANAVAIGVLGKLDVRALLRATGRAIIEVTLPPVHGRASAKASAKIGLAAHTEVRAKLDAKGGVSARILARLRRRAPVIAKPQARVLADGVVYVRRWIRSPVDASAVTFIVSNTRIDARLATLTKARALIAAAGHALRRSPTRVRAYALIEIDADVHKRLPFDEQAPDSRTFRVPEVMNTFYVTDQGTNMFRISPPMQPADTQDYDIVFDDWFPPGDEIVSVELKVVPAMPMPPSYAFIAQTVKVWVYSGGTSGEKYKISITATTNDGRTKEIDLIVPIKEV